MKVTRAQGLAWRNVDGETVVIHLGRRWIFGLDETAGEMWEALSEPRTVQELRELVDGQEADDSNVIHAVQRFVADLADEGLVASDSQTPPSPEGGEVVVPTSPRILWREELRQFAGQCHLVFGQSHKCNQNPGAS